MQKKDERALGAMAYRRFPKNEDCQKLNYRSTNGFPKAQQSTALFQSVLNATMMDADLPNRLLSGQRLGPLGAAMVFRAD